MHAVNRWVMPRDYFGAEWPEWYSAGFGRSRDSDAIEESNFEVALKTLEALRADSPDGEETTVQVVRENHWAVGWVEWIAIHESNIQAYQKAIELCEKANDYVVLDEDHFSNLEYERAVRFWDCLSLPEKVDMCQECGVSIFAARRNYDLPDKLWDRLVS